MIRRREFITLLGGAAAAWPLAARAQQAAMPVIGLLRSTTTAPFAHLVAELHSGLSEESFVGSDGMRELHNRRLGAACVSCSPAPRLAPTCGASCAPHA